MPGIASAATSILIAHIAGATSRIRVGAGGIMLPNHSPLVIAEQFDMESLFPGRIDRARACAWFRSAHRARAAPQPSIEFDQFPQDVIELMDFMSDAPRQAVRAVPGMGLKVPVWILRIEPVRCTTGRGAGSAHAFRTPISRRRR